MDTSETYIKMSDCPEIQGATFGKTGDVVVVKHVLHHYNGWQEYGKGEVEIVGNDGEYDITEPSSEDFIWLPRQDQLQEMVISSNPKVFTASASYLLNHLMCEVFEWSEEHWVTNTKLYYEQFTSMEQLWLAFVMKEKFNKVWSGAEWTR